MSDLRHLFSKITESDPRRAARIAAFAARRAADDAERQTKIGGLLLEAASGQRIVSDARRGERLVSLTLGDVVDRVTLAMVRGATPDDVTRLVASDDLGPLGARADWTTLRETLHAIARERGIGIPDVDRAFGVDTRVYSTPEAFGAASHDAPEASGALHDAPEASHDASAPSLRAVG